MPQARISAGERIRRPISLGKVYQRTYSSSGTQTYGAANFTYAALPIQRPAQCDGARAGGARNVAKRSASDRGAARAQERVIEEVRSLRPEPHLQSLFEDERLLK